VTLAHYLQQSRPAGTTASPSSPTLAVSPEPFAVIHELDALDGAIRAFDALEGLDEFDRQPSQVEGGRLVFLRGYPSPQWLLKIGVKYQVDPDIYQRHLRFQTIGTAERNHFSLPSLPSASTKIVQLPITTICSKITTGGRRGPEDMEPARETSTEALIKYYGSIKQNANVADSIVRGYSVVSKQHSVLEQTVSINVVTVEDSWHGQSNPFCFLFGRIFTHLVLSRRLARQRAGPMPERPRTMVPFSENSCMGDLLSPGHSVPPQSCAQPEKN